MALSWRLSLRFFWCVLVSTLFAAVSPSVPPALADVACPRLPPVSKIPGQNVYIDQKGAGSIPNEAIERDNAASQKVILDFLTYMEKSLDANDGSLDTSKVGCVRGLVQQWALSNALLAPPDAAAARVARIQFNVALNVIAIKQRRRGIGIDPVEALWLRDLTTAVTTDYGRDTLRGTPYYRNNAYFWAGAAAGLYLLIAEDKSLATFQDTAWSDMLAMIQPDGTLAAEILRGRRALIYHQFSLSALLLLREVRIALGLPVTPHDMEKVNRLAGAVGRALCEPAWMAALAKVPDQEIPGDWGFRVMSVFDTGLTDDRWHRCGTVLANPADTKLGGNLRNTLETIRAVRKTRH